MTRRRIPLSAQDPRLLQFWLRGTLAPTLVAEVAPDSNDFRARTGRMTKLSQLLHEVRATAKEERLEGWEALYSAIQRITRNGQGRIVRISIEPRALTNDDLLGPSGPAATLRAPVPVALQPIPDDILADVFGTPPEA